MSYYDDISRPAHYAAGRRFEVIEVLEDWAQFAPNVKQGLAYAQALKYLGRMWSKDTPSKNLSKAIWYLERLEQHLLDDDHRLQAPEQPLAAPQSTGNIDLMGTDVLPGLGGFQQHLSSTGDILGFNVK